MDNIKLFLPYNRRSRHFSGRFIGKYFDFAHSFHLLGLPMACPRIAASGRKELFAHHGGGPVQDSHLLPFRLLDFITNV